MSPERAGAYRRDRGWKETAMKLALFGVTGTCGGPLLDAALGAGHEVRALARAPQKLDRADPRLAVVTGDCLLYTSPSPRDS